ncbi:MAG: amidohydrolase family protein [Verrucomicrobiaceae bacterium]|nr:amidohydrolase family protein [Verrucomicrobiaceae bacterium]
MKFFLMLAPYALLLPLSAQQDVRPVEGLRQNDPSVHALVGGKVVSSKGELEATIIIRDGKIQGIGANLDPPAGARVWDVSGRRIYSGFIEPWWEVTQEDEKKGAHWHKGVRPERMVSSGTLPTGDMLKKRRALGFCVAHMVGDAGIFRGQGAVVLLREGKRGEQVIVPSSGQVIDFANGGGGYPSSLMGAIALVRQTCSDARWYRAASAAHLANPAVVPRPADDRSLAALDLGGRSFLIARDELDYARIAALSAEFKFSSVLRGNGHEYRRVADVRRLGSPLILSMNFPGDPAIGDVTTGMGYSLADLEHWELAPSNPAFLESNGIDFSLTAHSLEDVGGKFWKHVRLAVKRGLPAGVALEALTLRPARMLGIEGRCGDISPGKIANLVVAKGDLFTDEEAEVSATWVDGLPYLSEKEDTPDASGVWEISWPEIDKPLKWQIGSGKKLKVKSGKDSFDARWKGDRLLLFPPATLVGGEEHFARLSATFDPEKKTLSGIAVTPGGKTFWWDGKRTGDADKPEDKDKEKGAVEENKDNEEEVPALAFDHYPAGAYGLAGMPEQPERLIVRGATVWTCGPAGVINNADVLIEKGRVIAVGKSLKVPDGAIVIDAAGRHVTPGLIDCHSHAAISRGVNEGTHSVTVEVRIGDVIDPTDISLYRQLGGGLTTANLLHGSANAMGGQNQVIKLRWGSGAEGLRFRGAKPGVKFALGENVKQSNWGPSNTTRYPQTRMGVEQIMKDSFIAAQEYRAEMERAGREGRPHRRNLRLEAALEILEGERIVHIHSYRQDEILMFVRLAQEFGFTVGTFQHVLEGYKVADAMAEIGAGGSTFSDWWAYKFEVYDAIAYNGALMHEAGVVTSFNSDNSELACRMNTEAAKAVKYGGVSEEEALKFVTLNPAKQLRIDKRVGSLEAGKDADFVIWSGHPLSTYSRAEQTWIDGRRYFDLETDARLRQQVRKDRGRLVARAMKKFTQEPEKADEEVKEEKDKQPGGKRLVGGRSPYLPWVPINNCITVTRGLYHNGTSLHTCTSAGCCALR